MELFTGLPLILGMSRIESGPLKMKSTLNRKMFCVRVNLTRRGYSLQGSPLVLGASLRNIYLHSLKVCQGQSKGQEVVFKRPFVYILVTEMSRGRRSLLVRCYRLEEAVCTSKPFLLYRTQSLQLHDASITSTHENVVRFTFPDNPETGEQPRANLRGPVWRI